MLNYVTGEALTDVKTGIPMVMRTPGASFNLKNFFRAHVYSAIATLKIGMEMLGREGISISSLTGHGGLFKTKGVAQQYLANALNTPVSVMKTAGEGGSWGMALLAAYMICGNGKSLPEWLETSVFNNRESSVLKPDDNGSKSFAEYMNRYNAGLAAEKKLGDV